MQWEIKNQLAGSARPGRELGRTGQVPQHVVDAWISKIRELGVPSIICLLDDEQLSLYKSLPMGLIAYYRQQGFTIEHIPTKDHQEPPLSQSELDDIWQAYQQLPKPVLVHCSAGAGRTGQAVQHIKAKLARPAD